MESYVINDKVLWLGVDTDGRMNGPVGRKVNRLRIQQAVVIIIIHYMHIQQKSAKSATTHHITYKTNIRVRHTHSYRLTYTSKITI
jgi:hypothetical protein